MSSVDDMNGKKTKGLTGRHVLFTLLGFFGVMIAVNAYFVVVAVKSFPGEDVPRSYRQGLEYNTTIAAREAQAQLGWTARVNVISSKSLIVEITDKNGKGVDGLSTTGTLRHLVDMGNDMSLNFENTGGGRYVANLDPIPEHTLSGRWVLNAQAVKGDDSFKLRREIWVK